MDFIWVKRKDCKVLLQDSTLVVILGVFFSLVGVLCYVADKLTHNQALATPAEGIADIFTKYGNRFMSFILIGLGTFIFLDSHSFSLLNLLYR